ncbi:MAG: hypothetical protein CSA05_02135 [Bacteroidia bacterium]|nr:MAG: hypothetical protein CSA05_02135 [Bacteroidia bacterium]
MLDKLERFVIDHKDEFDIYQPREELWDKIEKRPKQIEKIPFNWKKYAYRAAVVTLIFMSSFFIQKYFIFNPKQQASQTEEAAPELQIPELIEAEIYYTGQINTRFQEVQKYFGNNPELEEQINYDFKELDVILEELKNDLKENIATEEIVNAMIQNYRIKVKILENLLYQIRKSEPKTNSDEQNERKTYDL